LPRVIFMTGALRREDLEIINSVDPTLIIRKPFSIQNLREAVERALTPEPTAGSSLLHPGSVGRDQTA
ncbi:MAG: hypothetical protein ACREOS_13910, partial [Candidatus Dormibacteraceae bacterium]